ncbi:MAG: hypothetical protein LBT60_06390, partial [Oscillospiraceae bacterium]|nr:hypothetical protein [Oscillospiraceae bacterium]
LEQELAAWGDGHPRELAAHILEAAQREKGRGDDMTALAVRVGRREDRGQKAEDRGATAEGGG